MEKLLITFSEDKGLPPFNEGLFLDSYTSSFSDTNFWQILTKFVKVIPPEILYHIVISSKPLLPEFNEGKLDSR